MATYYKYAERSADSTINWAEVGQNMTDMLQEEARVREAKKAAIDEETRKLGENLSNAPMGEFEPANQFALNFAGDAQETRLIQDRLLRSGMLRPKDYAIMRQNLNDGTKTMFDLSKAYQAEAARKRERMSAEDPAKRSQLLESWFMEQVEGLGNLSQAKAVINQTNGQVSIGKMIKGKDGVMTLDPNYNYTVNELNTRIKQDFNYFNVDKAMLQEEAMLGEAKSMILNSADSKGELNMIYSIVDKKQGKYLTDSEEAALQAAVDNATTEAERTAAYKRQQEALAANSYLAAEDAIIKKQMVNQFNTTSILTNDIGGYTYEFDEKKAFDENGNRRQDVILIKKNPSGAIEAEFTDEQKKKAEDFMRLNLRSKISTSEEAKSAGLKPYSPYDSAAAGKLAKEDAASGNLLSWNEIYRTNDPAVVKSQFESLTNSTGVEFTGFESLTVDENGQLTGEIEAIKGDIKETITFPPVNQLEWSEQGKFIHGVKDRSVQERILKKNKYDLDFTRDSWDTDLTDGWKTSETEIESLKEDKPQIVADQWESDLDDLRSGEGTFEGYSSRADKAEELLGDAGYLVTQKTKTDDDGNESVVTVIVSAKNPDKVLEQQTGKTISLEKMVDVLNTVDPKTNTGVQSAYKKRGKKELPKAEKKT